jgi:anti-sigma regulatory factor (Ser/Thr protein kinase)
MSPDVSPVAESGTGSIFVEGAIALRLELTSSLSHLHHAVVAIRSWCELSEAHRASSWKIELAVMEALTNVVVHAYGEHPGQPIVVSWVDRPNCLSIEIRDWGASMSSSPDRGLPDATEEGGRGWPIIRACLDRVKYECRDGVNVLTLEKHVSPDS